MEKKHTFEKLVVTLAMLGALGVFDTFGDSGTVYGWQQSNTGNNKAVRVEVVNPSRRAITRELQTPATLRADERVDLFAKVSGYVERINVDIGDRVSKGDVLVRLAIPEMADEIRQAEALHLATQSRVRALEAKVVQTNRLVDTARAQVKQYQAQHELGQLNLDRKKALREGNAIPQQAMDEAQSAHTITEAKLAIAQAQVAGAQAEQQAALADVEVAKADVMVAQAKTSRLKTLSGYASVRAPFDGVVTMRGVDPGTFVRSAADGVTKPLVRVSKIDSIRVVLEIPENEVPFVRPGTIVHVTVKALGAEPITAKVSRIAGALNPRTRTMRAEVDLDNKEGKLAPGMYAQVIVELSFNEQALAIPSKALRVDGKETIVFVCQKEVVESRPVKVGYDDGIWAEILTGLSEGDLVITSTGGTIVSGMPVRSFPAENS